jgi:hypothetical protein
MYGVPIYDVNFSGPIANFPPQILSPPTTVELVLEEITTVATCVDGEIAYTAQSSFVPKKSPMVETSTALPPLNSPKRPQHLDPSNTECQSKRIPVPARSPISEHFHTRSPVTEHFPARSPITDYFPPRSPKTEMFDKPWTETMGGISPERSAR